MNGYGDMEYEQTTTLHRGDVIGELNNLRTIYPMFDRYELWVSCQVEVDIRQHELLLVHHNMEKDRYTF